MAAWHALQTNSIFYSSIEALDPDLDFRILYIIGYVTL